MTAKRSGVEIHAWHLYKFLPVGLLLVWALRRWTALQRHAVFCVAAAFGFSLSLAIESTQALLPSRVSSAGDLLLNSAGAALGAVLALVAGWLPRRSKSGDPAS